MKAVSFHPIVLLGLLSACAASGGSDSPDPAPVPAPQTVNAQSGAGVTSPTVVPATPANPAPAPVTAPAPAPVPAPAPALAPAPAPAPPPMPAPPSPAGLSGWWYDKAGTSTLKNASKDLCKGFLLINESQMKMADGYECWYPNSATGYFFHVTHVGTITAESTTTLSYSVTGGCSGTPVGAAIGETLAKSSDGYSLTITGNPAYPLETASKIDLSSANSWYLQVKKYNIQAGCVGSDGALKADAALQAALISLSN